MSTTQFRVIVQGQDVGIQTMRGARGSFKPNLAGRDTMEAQSDAWARDFRRIVGRLAIDLGPYGPFSSIEDEDSGIRLERL